MEEQELDLTMLRHEVTIITKRRYQWCRARPGILRVRAHSLEFHLARTRGVEVRVEGGIARGSCNDANDSHEKVGISAI